MNPPVYSREERLARLERAARLLGLELEARGARRTFTLADRWITFRPQGRTTMKVEATLFDDPLGGAVLVMSDAKVEAFMERCSKL